MKLRILVLLAFAAIPVVADTLPTILARWTFDGLPSSFSYAPGSGVATTNFYADAGVQAGTAALTGWHYGFGATTYSAPQGNPATGRALSATGWTNSAAAAAGDYYQAVVTTLGYQDIVVSFDQYASSTGPGRFYLAYSTDGTIFTQVGDIYSVAAGAWSSHTNDLRLVANVADQPTVYLRLAVANNGSASGATIGTSGTCRLDNFTVTGNAAGLPSLSGQVTNGCLILNWSSPTFYLQSSTNLAGPYGYVTGATSPYTNDTVGAPAVFFRLTSQAPN